MKLIPIPQPTETKKESLVPIAVIIAALAGLLISIFAARASLPVFLYYIAVILLLLAIFALLFYGFLGEPIYNFIKKRREIRKHTALARKYFNKFKHFTETFGEFVDPNRSDITKVLKDLQSDHVELRELLFLPKDDIHSLFKTFQQRLKRFDRTYEDFLLLVEEFDIILDIYNKRCIRDPIQKIRRIDRNRISDRFKEDYRRHKGAYERFIGNYTDFGKEVNKEFGERIRIFREAFDMPEEL